MSESGELDGALEQAEFNASAAVARSMVFSGAKTASFRAILEVSMPRVPSSVGPTASKIPGKMTSLTSFSQNTGVCSKGEMQFRLARPPSTTRSRPFAHTRRSPLGPAQRLLRSAAPRSRPFAHTRRSPLGPAQRLLRIARHPLVTFCARRPPPARACSEAFAHAPRRPPGARSGLLRGFCAPPDAQLELGTARRSPLDFLYMHFWGRKVRVCDFDGANVHGWLCLGHTGL